MMNIRQRSVNVSRVELLAKLKENLATHRKEYQEALVEYHTRLQEDLKLALKKVGRVVDIEELKSFRFSVSFPQNHEKAMRWLLLADRKREGAQDVQPVEKTEQMELFA